MLFWSLAFLVQIPDPTFAARRGSQSCKYLEISSNAGLNSVYPNYLGVFKKETLNHDGRSVYLKSNDIALWWSTQVTSWKIGHKRHEGSNTGNVYNSKSETCNDDLSLINPECFPWWKYWNGEEWQYDNTVKIKCFDHDYTMHSHKYCQFPEGRFLQTETRFDDLGNATRACDELDEDAEEPCTEFYFSKLDKAFYICPTDSEIRERNGYSLYVKPAPIEEK